ncbi:MAG: hypothetical protein QNJ55_19210 [Xenococcus sp. MO_188.B8]|nr:hypothetical protein [Xenococcus sp. MO_188.B8]
MNIIAKQKNNRNLAFSVTLASAISILKSAEANALSVTFDYTYDDNNFFDPGTTEGLDRRNTLTQAGQYFTNYINDSLSAISSGSGIADVGGNGGSNTWTASFFHPATGNTQTILDLTVPADKIIVYAGGRDLSSLGTAGTGGFTTASGSSAFINLIAGRGQAGALTDPKTDIGLWGGSLSFDTNIVIDSTTYDWHNTTDSAGLDSNEFDFLSTAIHELGHIFGFSSLEGSSWANQIEGTSFTGTNALDVYRAETDLNATSVPLKSNSLAHWDELITSLTLAGDSQEAAFGPNISEGQRKLLTNLDYAGLEDIGWEVNTASVPFEFSPALGILLMCGFFGSLFIKKRLRGKTRKLVK